MSQSLITTSGMANLNAAHAPFPSIAVSHAHAEITAPHLCENVEENFELNRVFERGR